MIQEAQEGGLRTCLRQLVAWELHSEKLCLHTPAPTHSHDWIHFDFVPRVPDSLGSLSLVYTFKQSSHLYLYDSIYFKPSFLGFSVARCFLSVKISCQELSLPQISCGQQCHPDTGTLTGTVSRLRRESLSFTQTSPPSSSTRLSLSSGKKDNTLTLPFEGPYPSEFKPKGCSRECGLFKVIILTEILTWASTKHLHVSGTVPNMGWILPHSSLTWPLRSSVIPPYTTEGFETQVL